MYVALSVSLSLWQRGIEQPPPLVDVKALATTSSRPTLAPLAPEAAETFDALPLALQLLEALRGYEMAWQFLASTSAGLRSAQLNYYSELLMLFAAWHDRAEPRLRVLALMDVVSSRFSLWGAVSGVRANRAKVFSGIINLKSILSSQQSMYRNKAEHTAENKEALATESGKPGSASSLFPSLLRSWLRGHE